MTVNYVVKTQDWSGKQVTECETEQQVWNAIGSASFGALYEVSSPTGLSCDKFIPF
jgi:hypothetical protein